MERFYVAMVVAGRESRCFSEVRDGEFCLIMFAVGCDRPCIHGLVS